MLYALTESSLISSLPLSISPSFSATPYLPRSLWIALCLPVSPPKCGQRDINLIVYKLEKILMNENEVGFHSQHLSVRLFFLLVCSVSECTDI